MPQAPRSPAHRAGMQTKLSAWTPLSHPAANSKVFEERRALLAKWFDRWSDGQRRAVLQDFVLSCSREQLRYLSVSVSGQLPLQAADFACLLPRALCLYIFSFLDPRSLCRCAQVSWHWRSIVELDQLWMPKCLRLGWCAGSSPTPLEQGVWKGLYIQSVQELRLSPPQTAPSPQQFVIPDVTALSSRRAHPSGPALLSQEAAVQRAGSGLRFGSVKDKQPTALPPWRDSDRRPKDTLRFNYLDNMDPGTQALSASTSQPRDGSKKSPSEATYKLRKAKSLMFLSSNCRPQHPPPPPHHQTQTQPQQAPCGNDRPITKETARSLLGLAQWNAGVRPGPTRLAVPRLSMEALRASRRSNRSSPNECPHSET
ncbi:putative F-box only protein 16 [Scophthalmus maximus]|uniref:Putative F-box only protein 16 n=1 Tax=Scophthalmus maximus TaxID=52904 RepID=A0A2U9CUP5_SCOMX|nr:putative F-box only protein 16 [Scophthalmus maximus]